MKLRPQFQLRFRDAEQFVELKKAARRISVSMNEYILGRLEAGDGRKEVEAGGSELRSGDSQLQRKGVGVGRQCDGTDGVAVQQVREDPEAPVVEAPRCPDDGAVMVLNSNVRPKRWECVCGFQMKQVGARK